MTTARLRVVDIHGSPYSRKLLAALRYRRIPYSWIVKDSPEDTGLPSARVSLLPQLVTEDADGNASAVTAPVIEESYKRSLGLLSDHLASHRFLMGSRPGASDFAVYGQLTQLTGFDPTPTAIAHSIAPRVVAWVDFVEELSGIEPAESDWIRRDGVPATLRALLAEAGRVYVPFLLANAKAMTTGADTVNCTIDGKAWTQKPFPYQAKCLGWLRQEYAGLSDDDRRDANALLAGSGCEALFAIV